MLTCSRITLQFNENWRTITDKGHTHTHTHTRTYGRGLCLMDAMLLARCNRDLHLNRCYGAPQ